MPEGQALELSIDLDWDSLRRSVKDVERVAPLIATTIQRSGEVRMRDLDAKGRKQFSEAKLVEIKSWLRYEAVRAALRNRFNAADVMKMRWILRYKESGTAKARLVIIGYHDPRLGSEVRTEAPVASRRGRGTFFMAAAHYGFFIEKRGCEERVPSGTY